MLSCEVNIYNLANINNFQITWSRFILLNALHVYHTLTKYQFSLSPVLRVINPIFAQMYFIIHLFLYVSVFICPVKPLVKRYNVPSSRTAIYHYSLLLLPYIPSRIIEPMECAARLPFVSDTLRQSTTTVTSITFIYIYSIIAPRRMKRNKHDGYTGNIPGGW